MRAAGSDGITHTKMRTPGCCLNVQHSQLEAYSHNEFWGHVLIEMLEWVITFRVGGRKESFGFTYSTQSDDSDALTNGIYLTVN